MKDVKQSARAALAQLSEPISAASAVGHNQQDIELSPVQSITAASTVDGGGSELPPVDRGRGAMGFLAVAFFLELMLWGYAGAFGVIQVSVDRSSTSFRGGR